LEADLKKLGLVGGMGPESTIPYYHDIVYGVQARAGKDYFPNLTIEKRLHKNHIISPVPCLDTMQIHIQDIICEIISA